MPSTGGPEIREAYKQYVPAPWILPTVQHLLQSLAPEHLGGLRVVVLTDSAAIGKGKTRRVGKRKYLQPCSTRSCLHE